MQKVTVWSAGNEKAITGKINLTCYTITFILLCNIHILSFICNPYDDKTANVKLIDHIAFGGLVLFILGFNIGYGIYLLFKSSPNPKLLSLFIPQVYISPVSVRANTA